MEENNICPMCKCIFEYKTNNEIKDKLNKILFKCIFSRNGCIIKCKDYWLKNEIKTKYIFNIFLF